MREKETMSRQCINDLEKALLEYVETYGPTDKAKKAFGQLSVARDAFGNDFDG